MRKDCIDLMEPPEFIPISETVIDLEPAQLDQARSWSLAIPDREAQWQAYQNGLALLGLHQWLAQRGGDLIADWSDCSLLHPLSAQVIPAVCNISVNSFQLCLIATESQPDEVISLPRVAIDLPRFQGHFYLLISVAEEQAQIQIQGVLRSDQLVAQLRTLAVEPDWTYSVPRSWFDPEVDRLLLYLRCAAPGTIARPQPSPLLELQPTLLERLPQLVGSSRPWWQILTWEEGAAVLSQPALMDWVSHPQPNATQHLADLLQLLTRPVINAALWLQGQVDELAEQLAWTLLPAAALSQMRLSVNSRPATDDFEAVLTHLIRHGLTLPPDVTGVCQPLAIGTTPARLYAIVGALPSGEWTLLVILGPAVGSHLPYGTELRISDLSGILVQQVLTPPTEDDYLFAQITGTPAEQFLVTLTIPAGGSLTLPPFAFHPSGNSL